MITKENFIFTIGYEGSAAVVDGKAKEKYGKLDTKALAEKNLFRAAFASALYSGSETELETFAAIFNAKSGTSYKTFSDFQRLFGVKQENIKRTIIL